MRHHMKRPPGGAPGTSERRARTKNREIQTVFLTKDYFVGQHNNIREEDPLKPGAGRAWRDHGPPCFQSSSQAFLVMCEVIVLRPCTTLENYALRCFGMRPHAEAVVALLISNSTTSSLGSGT